MGLLSQFSGTFNAAEVKPRGEYESIPDGKYQAKIDRVEVKESSTKKPMVSWQLVVIGGPMNNRRVFKNDVLSTDENVVRLKETLINAGFTGTLEQLEAPGGTGSLLDRVVQITVKTKGEYHNVYINKTVNAAGATAAHADEPAPF